MEQKYQAVALSADKVSRPGFSLNDPGMLVNTYIALAEGFKSCQSVLVHDKVVDHGLIEAWFSEFVNKKTG